MLCTPSWIDSYFCKFEWSRIDIWLIYLSKRCWWWMFVAPHINDAYVASDVSFLVPKYERLASQLIKQVNCFSLNWKALLSSFLFVAFFFIFIDIRQGRQTTKLNMWHILIESFIAPLTQLTKYNVKRAHSILSLPGCF